jgi:hypothetical protein
MRTLWKASLWIGGALVVLAAAIVLAETIWMSGFLIRTHDQSVLKAIKAESLTLMATAPTETYSNAPKSRWPRMIASLKPQWVTVYPGHGVLILITPFFDGGWRYYVPKSEQEPPEPGCSRIGQGVHWCRPY